jgi:carbonic anhydrase
MFVEQILKRNHERLQGRQPEPLPPVPKLELAVIGCYDPRLDRLLLPALGLESGQAFLFRSAGAVVKPGSDTLRSLGLATFMFGVTEVLVVGHLACRMAAFDTAGFIEEFRRRGVPRDAFGEDSLRTWAGAIPSPRQGVLDSVAAVREARFLPRDVRVWGAVLDDATGKLDVVVRPEERVEAASERQTPAADERPARPAPPPPPGAAPTPATHAAAEAAAAPAAAGSRIAQTVALLEAVDGFLTTVESKERIKGEAVSLRRELGRRRDPRQRVELLDAFARKLATDSRDVAESFAKLRREIAATGADPAAELLSVLQQLGRRR